MDANELLAWARGPGFDIALIIFVAGMLLGCWRSSAWGRSPTCPRHVAAVSKAVSEHCSRAACRAKAVV